MGESIQTLGTQYDTKNYLKSRFIDDEWIETLQARNEKKESE